jgi:hypothetical protein
MHAPQLSGQINDVDAQAQHHGCNNEIFAVLQSQVMLRHSHCAEFPNGVWSRGCRSHVCVVGRGSPKHVAVTMHLKTDWRRGARTQLTLYSGWSNFVTTDKFETRFVKF